MINIQNFSSKIDNYLPLVIVGNSVKMKLMIDENDRKIKNIINYTNYINNSNDPLLIQPINILNIKLNKIKSQGGKLSPTQTVQFLVDDTFENLLTSTINFLDRVKSQTGGRRKKKSRKIKKLKRKFSRKQR